MALKSVLDDLDSVEEQHRPLYEDRDGKYVLQVEGIEAHPGALSLKAALDRVRSEKRAVSEKLAAAEGRLHGLPEDFGAEAFEDLKARAEGGQQDEGKIAERLDRQKAVLEGRHAREIEAERVRAQKLEANLRKVMVDDGLTKALLDAGIEKQHLGPLKAYLKESGRIKLTEEDGEFHVFADNGIDERTPLSKFVGDWAGTDEGKPYVAKVTGGDAKGGSGQRFAENPWETHGGKVKPNLTKQQEIIAANPEKARQMAQAAGAQPNW